MNMTTNPFKAEKQEDRQQLDMAKQFIAGEPLVSQKAEGAISPDRVALAKSNQQESIQTKQLDKLKGITSFDWKQIPPPFMAELLMQTPFRGGTGEPDYYLSAYQAYRFAIRCYELGLSPLSTEVWYNPKNNMTNVTFEGKLKLARDKKLNLGPPRFERVTRKTALGKEDYGYKCTMSTGRPKMMNVQDRADGPEMPMPVSDNAEYTAWYSEWFVSSSPVWKAKPDHMLQLRAAEKCLSFASGIGASELMDDRDINIVPSVTELVPEVT